MLGKNTKKLLLSLGIVISLSFLQMNSVKAKQLSQSYNITNAANYEITYTFQVTNTSRSPLTNVDLELVPCSAYDESPFFQITSDLKAEGGQTVIDSNGLEKVKINVASLNPSESKTITLKRGIKTGCIDYKVDKSSLKGDYSDFENYTKYTSPEDRIESDNQQIKDKSTELTNGLNNPYDKAHNIFCFVVDNMRYSPNGPDVHKGALAALNNKEGAYDDYSNLFVALCRAQGIPARSVVGYKASGRTGIDMNSNYHQWAEFYLPEYGWILVDPAVNPVVKEDSFAKENVTAGHVFEGYSVKGLSLNNSSYISSLNISLSGVSLAKKSDEPNYTVTPYSSYQSRVDDSKKATEKAEASRQEADIEKAKQLVNTLVDGQEKTNLISRLAYISSYENNIEEAVSAVQKAEQTKNKADYDAAVLKVNNLPDNYYKSVNQQRLSAVKASVDTSIKAAKDLVTKAEGSKSNNDVTNAESVIANIPAGWDIQDLKDRITAVKREISGESLYQEQLKNATIAVAKAEVSMLQADVNYARASLNGLRDADKLALNSRLDAVQQIINNYPNYDKNYIEQLTRARDAVSRAEMSRIQIDVDNARRLVSDLKEVDKSPLVNRLNAVQQIINNSSYPDSDYKVQLSRATDAVSRAESSRYQSDVNSARDLVRALRESDRVYLNNRLDSVQRYIDQNRWPEDRNWLIRDCISKVELAERSYSRYDFNAARSAVNDLPYCSEKTDLNSRLNSLERNLDGNYSYRYRNAIDLVEKAESSRQQSSIDTARSYVSELKDDDRRRLNSRLNSINVNYGYGSYYNGSYYNSNYNYYYNYNSAHLDNKRYRNFGEKVTTEYRKTWTIRFSGKVNQNTVHQNSIFIIDTVSDRKIPVILNTYDNQVTIRPSEQLEKNRKYLIVIKEVRSNRGKTSLPSVLSFRVV